MRRVLVLAAIIGASLLGTAGVAHATPSPDGTGALDYAGSPVESGSSGNRLTFTFSLASGEQFQEGEFRITVPAGWSAPSTSSADPGYTTTDCTFVPSVSGQV